MVAVTDDTLCAAFLNGLAMGSRLVFLGHADMATAAEIRNFGIIRSTDKTPVGALGHGHIARVATVTIVTGDAVFGMHAVLPIGNRRAEMTGQAGVALQTNGFVSEACRRNRPQDQAYGQKRPDDNATHE